MAPSSPDLQVRHIVPQWPPDDAVLAAAKALPGTSCWMAIAGRQPSAESGVVCLRAGPATPLQSLRRRYRSAVEGRPPFEVEVFHSPWGTDLLPRVHAQTKRVLWQHSPVIGTRAGIDRIVRLVDALWFDREPWRASIEASHRWIPTRRLQHLPLVFGGLQPTAEAVVEKAPPTVLGWVGELAVAGTRADRLIPMAAALREVGFMGRLEICGRGKLEKKLRRRLADFSVSFFPPEEWEHRRANWDGLLCLSNDTSWTLPVVRSLQEGRALLLPVDEWCEDLPEGLTYPAGDLGELAAHWTPAATERRARARALGVEHLWQEAANGAPSRGDAAVALLHSLRPRTIKGEGLWGGWPFALYRRIHRLLLGRN